MVRPRLFGSEETPFGKWLRNKGVGDGPLPSSFFAPTDVDMILHRYLSGEDAMASREVQHVLWLEVKTRNGTLSSWQHETLFYYHQLLYKTAKGSILARKLRRLGRSPVSVWSYGVSILQLPGVSPDDFDYANYGRFDIKGEIQWRRIGTEQLIGLCAFNLRPDTLAKMSLRRHHRTRVFELVQTMPLGFDVTRSFVQRS